MSKLNERQKRFCEEYVVSLNATEAAIKAGYSNKTRNAASVLGSKLLGSIHIQRYISQLQAKRQERVEITQDRVLLEIYRLAMVDVVDTIDPDTGSLKAIHDMPEPVRRAISSIEVDEIYDGSGRDRQVIGHTRKIKFWPKDKSLEMLGRHLRLFIDRLEVDDKRDMSSMEAAAKLKAGILAALVAK